MLEPSISSCRRKDLIGFVPNRRADYWNRFLQMGHCLLRMAAGGRPYHDHQYCYQRPSKEPNEKTERSNFCSGYVRGLIIHRSIIGQRVGFWEQFKVLNI